MNVRRLITLVIVMTTTLSRSLFPSPLLPSVSSQEEPYYQIQNTDFQGEDYGYWNPTPRPSNGGQGAPIPHAQVG